MKQINLGVILLLGFFTLGFFEKTANSNEPVWVYTTIKTNKIYKEKMIKGLLAIRGSYSHVTRAYAKKLVKETIEVTAMKGNRWMKPHDLLGLAINETDLRWWLVTGSYYKPDCGITQNHTPLFAKTFRTRKDLCKKLTRSTKLSFIYAMKELNMNRSMWCLQIYRKPTKKKTESLNMFNKRMFKWTNKQYQCAYNLYLQGPSYLKGPCIKRIRKKGRTSTEYRRKIYKCYYNNRYWLRTMCFAKGIEIGKKPRISCRRAKSLWWIKRVYRFK